jgi:hypothetical protein
VRTNCVRGLGRTGSHFSAIAPPRAAVVTRRAESVFVDLDRHVSVGERKVVRLTPLREELALLFALLFVNTVPALSTNTFRACKGNAHGPWTPRAWLVHRPSLPVAPSGSSSEALRMGVPFPHLDPRGCLRSLRRSQPLLADTRVYGLAASKSSGLPAVIGEWVLLVSVQPQQNTASRPAKEGEWLWRRVATCS